MFFEVRLGIMKAMERSRKRGTRSKIPGFLFRNPGRDDRYQFL